MKKYMIDEDGAGNYNTEISEVTPEQLDDTKLPKDKSIEFKSTPISNNPFNTPANQSIDEKIFSLLEDIAYAAMDYKESGGESVKLGEIYSETFTSTIKSIKQLITEEVNKAAVNETSNNVYIQGEM